MFKKAEEACLNGLALKNIEPLAALNLLQLIKLDNNLISDFSSLRELVELVYLDAKHNHVVDITHLTNLIKLRHLELSYN